jgi:hypothetical protein
MQHKFLMFICNINKVHWVSVVVVNPFLRFDQYLEEGKESNNPGKEKKIGNLGKRKCVLVTILLGGVC